jgi:hypothetical protein
MTLSTISSKLKQKCKFNIVEFFVVNFICVRLFAVGNYCAIDCLHLASSWRHVQVRICVTLGCETSLKFTTKNSTILNFGVILI